jgi:hypothetical protein
MAANGVAPVANSSNSSPPRGSQALAGEPPRRRRTIESVRICPLVAWKVGRSTGSSSLGLGELSRRTRRQGVGTADKHGITEARGRETLIGMVIRQAASSARVPPRFLPTRDHRLYVHPYEDRTREAQSDFIIIVRLNIGISCSLPCLPSHIVRDSCFDTST